MKTPRSESRSISRHCVYGINGCREILGELRIVVHQVELLDGSRPARDPQIRQFLERRGLQPRLHPKEFFQKQFSEARTQGIVVHFKGPVTQPLPDFQNLEGDICLLVLDHLTDPQNVGQIIRTAEGAGVSGIVIPKFRSSGLTDVVLQVSQGAFVHLPLYEISNIRNFLLRLQKEGFWVSALENSIEAKPWYDLDYSGKVILVVGSEGQGIQPLVLRTCDFHATIPMAGRIDSLNVTAAVSALLFERRRQLNCRDTQNQSSTDN